MSRSPTSTATRSWTSSRCAERSASTAPKSSRRDRSKPISRTPAPPNRASAFERPGPSRSNCTGAEQMWAGCSSAQVAGIHRPRSKGSRSASTCRRPIRRSSAWCRTIPPRTAAFTSATSPRHKPGPTSTLPARAVAARSAIPTAISTAPPPSATCSSSASARASGRESQRCFRTAVRATPTRSLAAASITRCCATASSLRTSTTTWTPISTMSVARPSAICRTGCTSTTERAISSPRLRLSARKD